MADTLPIPFISPMQPSLRQQLALQQANAADVAAMPAPPSIAPLAAPSMPSLPPIVPRGTSGPIAGTATGDQLELNRLNQTGSGVSQIHNPIARAALGTLDTLGSIFLPRVAAFTPGTTAHHNLLVNDQEQRLAQDRAGAQADAGLAQTQATTRLTNDKAKDDENPVPDTPSYDIQKTDQGLVAVNKANPNDTHVLTANNKPLMDEAKQKSPEQSAYDGFISQGQSPTQAFESMKAAGDTKQASLQQQFLDGYQKAHPEAPLTDAIAATIRATRTDPQITILNAGAANRAAANAPALGGSGTGDAYLASLPPQLQQIVKSTANGDIAIPPAGTRNKDAAAIRDAVLNYDPTYTDARYKGKQSFKTGPDATSVVQLGTALKHADNALSNSANVGFAPFLGQNATAQDAAYNKDVQYLTGEVGKLVTGGALTVDEGHRLTSGLDSSRQGIRDSAIKESLDLLSGKTSAIFQKYKTATGQELPVDQYFDKDTQSRLQKYNITGGSTSQSPSSNGGVQIHRDAQGRIVGFQ